jgi:NitT/TauT family transport system substrate-binding protein
MRRSFPLAVLGMLSLAMLVGSIIPSRAAGKDLHFVLDFMPDGFHAPFYAALEQGFYREEGVNVRISRGYGSGDTVRKIAAGQFDIGLAHLPAVIAARANEDAQIQAVMLYLTRDMLAIWVRDEGKINGPKDLEGKTVATTPGNAHFVMFPAFAKAVGFDAERIKWVTVDGAVMGPMLINKQVDAAPFFMSHGPLLHGLRAPALLHVGVREDGDDQEGRGRHRALRSRLPQGDSLDRPAPRRGEPDRHEA